MVPQRSLLPFSLSRRVLLVTISPVLLLKCDVLQVVDVFVVVSSVTAGGATPRPLERDGATSHFTLRDWGKDAPTNNG